jgi:hypothetical protein
MNQLLEKVNREHPIKEFAYIFLTEIHKTLPLCAYITTPPHAFPLNNRTVPKTGRFYKIETSR